MGDLADVSTWGLDPVFWVPQKLTVAMAVGLPFHPCYPGGCSQQSNHSPD